jgi:hypothetical protein
MFCVEVIDTYLKVLNKWPFLFALGKGKSSKRDLSNRLTIRYFDTVKFLTIKTSLPNYGSAGATIPLSWLQDK